MSATHVSATEQTRDGRRSAVNGSSAAAARVAAELAGGTAEEVARRLRVLGRPTRLELIIALAAGPRSVGELAEIAGLDPAAASKHLCELQRASMVTRRQDGTHAIYRLPDTTALKVMLLFARSVHADAARIAGALRVSS